MIVLKKSLPIESRLSQTKIVATLGPASSTQEQIVGLIETGVDVFRLNMAHAEPAEQEVRLATIRAASEQTGRLVAVLVDLAGPKIRLGEIPGGQMSCNAGKQIVFVHPSSTASHPSSLTVTYEPLLDELVPGDRILLADGTVSLTVESVDRDAARCRVVQPGVIRSRQGVNLPGVKLSVEALNAVDRRNAIWAAKHGVDFVGLSFVRKADDVRQLKSLLGEINRDVQVIAKIEKPEALEHLDEIATVSDGVMVARGDLGVEIDVARVAVAQKEIIAACNRLRKPVIVATQMLDSMMHSRIPTRAEVTDVSNAILDGADACMLSGETAIGEYPRETVEMMHRIALETERLHLDGTALDNRRRLIDAGACLNPITEATVSAAGHIAEELNAKVAVVVTASGATALSMAKNHHFVPTLGVSDSPATLRRMCLYWGVIPLADAPANDSTALLCHIAELGRQTEFLSPGDRIVLISGTGLSTTRHNMIVVHEIEHGS